MEELTTKLMLLTGMPDDERALADLLLEMAIADLLAETNRKVLPPVMQTLALDLASSYYTLRKAGGLKSISEGAISVSYVTERDPSFVDRIARYRKLQIAEADDAPFL